MTTADRPAAEPAALPTYSVLRRALIRHTMRRIEPLTGINTRRSRELAEALADDVLDPQYVAVLDERLADLLTTAHPEPDPTPSPHRWQAGDGAAWRGRAVTVVSPPDDVLVQLPNGGTVNVEPDELTPYTP